MTTIATNIRAHMKINRYTALAIDRYFEWVEGTMSQKLYRNENNTEHGFTVSDIARFTTLFNCTCTDLFRGVRFGKFDATWEKGAAHV